MLITLQGLWAKLGNQRIPSHDARHSAHPFGASHVDEQCAGAKQTKAHLARAQKHYLARKNQLKHAVPSLYALTVQIQYLNTGTAACEHASTNAVSMHQVLPAMCRNIIPTADYAYRS